MIALEKKTSIDYEPIIESILDIDLYKVTMGQFIWKHFPDVKVWFELVNRHADRVPVAELVDEDELRRELDYVRTLRLTAEEKRYLLENSHLNGIIEEEFVLWLEGQELPELLIERVGDQYRIVAEGPWALATYWETIVLSVLNELIGRAYEKARPDLDWRGRGLHALERKLSMLASRPFAGFVEFGTRRRWSRRWQEKVIETILVWGKRVNFVGTSNVHLARKFAIKPVGTFAHEMPMGFAALAAPHGDQALYESHGKFLQMWWEMYEKKLSVALSDTWGANFFFEDFTGEAEAWNGLRHDSGNPFEWGEMAIAFYEELGIDPKEKMLLFSDGLEVERIVSLYDRFAERTKVAFGWGTNLTNDVGFPATSLVMKLFAVEGVSTVKLSDNLAKAMGPKEEVERYVRVFGHSGSERSECKY